MTVSKAKRAANNKWDAANMAVITCKARRDLIDDFKAACRTAGDTPNALIRRMMEDYLAQAQEPEQPTPTAPEGQEGSE